MSERVSAVGLLAKRFLLSKSSDGFLSFIAWVSIVGVALGVLALTVVTSVINGFEGELAHVVTGMNGDVILYTSFGGEPIRDPQSVETRIKDALPDLQAITPSFISEMMATGPAGIGLAVLEGFDPDRVGFVTALPKRVIEGRLPQANDEVAVGDALAEKTGVKPGMDLRLVIPFFNDNGGDAASAVGNPKTVDVHVTGLVKMGMFEYDSKFLYMPLPGAQALLGQPGQNNNKMINTMKIRLMPGADSRAAAARLTDYFGYPFHAKSWADLNRNILYAIQLEKAVISIILTVIVIVAAFNVVSTLMMMIHDKTKEISILKAMGFRPWQSFRLFCMIGLGMGVVGTVFGVIFGVGLNWLILHTNLIHLPADIYYIGFLPVVVRWKEVGMIAAVAVAISFLATLYPGWKVARRSPLDGLRYE